MISKVYYKLRPPHEQEGREGDVVVSSYNAKSFIFVKTRNKWHQTQELLPKNVSRLKESELGATNMLGNLNLGKNKIAALGHNMGLGVDSIDSQVFVDSSSGFVVHHNMYLAKANYSKIYFDGTSSPNDYIMSSVDAIDIFAGGKGIVRFQSGNTSRDDGLVIPIGDKIIFSDKDLRTNLFGETADTSYYITRGGTEGAASLGIGFYANSENVLTLGAASLSLNKDNYELRFHDGLYYTGFKSHATMTANAMYTLPPAYPASNKILQSDTSGNLSWITDTEKSDEAIQDLVGAMFTSNTETLITATYQDGDGTIDLVVDAAAVTSIDGATENELVTIGSTTTELISEGNLTFDGDHLSIAATGGLYFDGGSNTQIYEASDDVLRIAVGGDIIMQFSEKGDDGNEVHFGSSCAGFTQLEPTYNSVSTDVDFRHSNKQNLTFGAGSITNINLFFPLVSGNFQLLVKQDGTGSRTITNYKVYEFDESSADGEIGVKFAGGSNPTLTTDANHVDILSFYWDADNEIAYGVATLDFQF